MNWFFIALSAPLLWAVTNHIDKNLVVRYSKEIKFTSFIISSAFFFLICALAILFFNHSVLDVPLKDAILLLLAGLLGVLYIFPYYYALDIDEASVVVPMFQLIPILGFFLGYLFLNEKLTPVQIVAGLIIIFSSLGLSLDLEKKIGIKFKVFLLMFFSSFIISFEALIYKIVGTQIGYWSAIFWLQLGLAIFSFLLLLIKSFRNNFVNLVVRQNPKFILFTGLNEIFNISASLLFNYAYLLAPIALVQLVGSLQPFFVLIIGTTISFFGFKLVTENITGKFLSQKIVFICLILVGSYLLVKNL